MKFRIKVKPFLQALMPVIEVAGITSQKYDVKKYWGVSPELLAEYEHITSRAIELSISKYRSGLESRIILKARTRAKEEICDQIRRDIYQLRRITINVEKDEISASSSNGAVTITSIIPNHSLVDMDFECDEGGELTVETGTILWALDTLKRYDRIEVHSRCDCRATIKPVGEKIVQREFPKFSYPIKSVDASEVKEIATIDRRTFLRGLKKVEFALGGSEVYQRLIVQILQKKLRFIGGNEELFAVYDVLGNVDLYEKKKKGVEIALDKEQVGPLIRSLSKMQKEKVEICFMKNSNSKKYQQQILFRQGLILLSVPEKRCTDKYPSLEGYLNYDYKYKVLTKPHDWKSYIGDKNCIVGIAGLPTANMKADFVYGHFSIEHGRRGKAQSYVPFIYDKKIQYVDTSSINSDEVSLTPKSQYLVYMLKKGRENDLVSVEFGINSKLSGKKPKDIVKDMILASYPARKNKKKGVIEEFFLLFPKNAKVVVTDK